MQKQLKPLPLVRATEEVFISTRKNDIKNAKDKLKLESMHHRWINKRLKAASRLIKELCLSNRVTRKFTKHATIDPSSGTGSFQTNCCTCARNINPNLKKSFQTNSNWCSTLCAPRWVVLAFVVGFLGSLPVRAQSVIDRSFQERTTGLAGTYTFINSPSRFRYRFSGRYNGYANRPWPSLYSSYTQQLNVGQARRLCRHASQASLADLRGELYEFGSQDDRRHNLLVGCSQRYQLVGSPAFLQSQSLSFFNSEDYNFTTATMIPIDEGEFENFSLPWDSDFDLFF